MPQGDVQHLVGEHETFLLLVQPGGGIQVDGAQVLIDGGDGDVLAVADLRVLHDLERGHHAAEEGKTADEPVACASGRGAQRVWMINRLRIEFVAQPGGHLHGLCDGFGDPDRELFRPGPVLVVGLRTPPAGVFHRRATWSRQS